MYEITGTENKNFKIPALDFRGTATGVDLVKVLETGSVPRINTGIAHKNPGVGQIGAGLVTAPMECFKKALDTWLSRNKTETKCECLISAHKHLGLSTGDALRYIRRIHEIAVAKKNDDWHIHRLSCEALHNNKVHKTERKS